MVANKLPVLLDQYGNPMMTDRRAQIQAFYQQQLTRMLKARFDSAQTVTGNENHWSNADHLDPITVASETVRKKLRSRSRYELIENNPFLKGTVLTIVSDFVGRGPKLQITDKRLTVERKKRIEEVWSQWAKSIRLRHKLWRMRMAKIVDGEAFSRMYFNPRRRIKSPVTLDYHVFECDRVADDGQSPPKNASPADGSIGMIDGVKFDGYENPLEYFILDQHPGNGLQYFGNGTRRGKWTPAEQVIHWFRQDRGWIRGIPELASSLNLCALLRRYTLALVRHAETAADFTAIVESEAPPGAHAWTDGNGNQVQDDPFDVFPIEMGMIMNLPWGYKIKQLEAVPVGTQYDVFVGSVLREITRPLLTPYNIVSGTSKDSNMASGVLDQNIYKGGQQNERTDCEEVVLDPMLDMFWYEASRIRGLLGDDFLSSDPMFAANAPEHTWRWDRIGLDHTDPSRVASALETLHNKRFLTDRDIQETYYNRDVEDWRQEIEEDDAFREHIIDFANPKPDPSKTPVTASGET